MNGHREHAIRLRALLNDLLVLPAVHSIQVIVSWDPNVATEIFFRAMWRSQHDGSNEFSVTVFCTSIDFLGYFFLYMA